MHGNKEEGKQTKETHEKTIELQPQGSIKGRNTFAQNHAPSLLTSQFIN